MPLTEKQTTEFLSEALDSQKVNLYCETHSYYGPSKNHQAKPAKNCPKCWMIFYFHDIASAAPHQRKQKLDELEEVLHNVVELVEKGKWDVTINPHAKVEFETN